MHLDWRPQEAFADYFYTNVEDILKHRSVFQNQYIYFVSDGGRGSGKTKTFTDAIIVEGSLRKCRILVTRELQNSIDESVKVEIDEAIQDRGLDSFYTSQKTEINGKNGTKIFFKGLKNNINSIKSIADVDIVLCEEAEAITKNSWDKLLPSIRPKGGKDPIIIVIFNPDSELDDTYTRFITAPPTRCIRRWINWQDNKYFPSYLEEQRLDAKRLYPKRRYEKIWEGVPTGSEGDNIIDLAWVKAARFASRKVKNWPAGNVRAAYDPSGQGRDFNAVVINDSNRITVTEEWLRSDNLRKATERAIKIGIENKADEFVFDTCGGLGDGVEVFVDEYLERFKKANSLVHVLDVMPFDAGAPVVDPDEDIPGTTKTMGAMYSNAKAQAHGITAQLLYNAFRFIILGEDIDPSEMLSIDIEDDELFNKICKELTAPLWIKSLTNSKKRVEDKEAMEKRTGQPSPNLADGIHMSTASFDTNMMNLMDKMAAGGN